MRLTAPGELPFVLNHSLSDLRPGEVVLVNLDTMVVSRPMDARREPRGCVPAVASELIPMDRRGSLRMWGRVTLTLGVQSTH